MTEGLSTLRGRWVIITGAAEGIGRATALDLAARGANLILVDKEREDVDELAAELTGEDRCVFSYGVDVADRAAMEELADWATHQIGGPVDLLVNNAGVVESGSTLETDWVSWERVMGVNFWGVLYGCRLFAPAMVERGAGAIVNVASTAGLVADVTRAAESASKAAVLGLSEALRAELAPLGVSVGVVVPGRVATPMLDRVEREHGEGERRPLDPQQVAEAIIQTALRGNAVTPVGLEATALDWVKRALPPTATSWLSGLRRR